MELAGRVFDVVTHPDNTSDVTRELLPPLKNRDELQYWRRVIRMAALCHDVGHLPFSRAAEKELLPEGWDHERLTQEIIESEEMKHIWDKMTPPLRGQDVVKLAVGPKKAKDLQFIYWEAILSEIIVGDAFGVDRMDYLLRDSLHAGVAYGRFDHYRLIGRFGANNFRHDRYPQRSGAPDFPVRLRNGDIVSSLAMSETLGHLPVVSVDYVFACRDIFNEAQRWLEGQRGDIVIPKKEGERI